MASKSPQFESIWSVSILSTVKGVGFRVQGRWRRIAKGRRPLMLIDAGARVEGRGLPPVERLALRENARRGQRRGVAPAFRVWS